MIRPGVVWGVARAEARLTRRLVRYWVFLVLALGIGVAGYLYYSFLHGFFSSYSATASSIGPRYLPGVVGPNYLLVLMIGMIFLGFDVRARDRRERMVEVLDARPCTNLEFLAGRFLGIFLPAWIPAFGLIVVLQLLGWVGLRLGWFMGPMESLSLVGFLVFQAIPALSFTLALVFIVTLLVRHRLISAVILIAILAGNLWITLRQPLYMTPLWDLTGGYQINFPSDILGWPVPLTGFLQRMALLLGAMGMLGLAAALHPRLDGGSRAARAGGGLALLLACIAGLAGLAMSFRADLGQIDSWEEAHAERKEDPVPDLRAVSADVRIQPGRSLDVEVQLRFRAPEEVSLDRALFTLNPGLRVERIADERGSEVSFTHHDGLLDLSLSEVLSPGEEMTVSMTARGRPHEFFAYLDAVRKPGRLTPWEGQIFLLGFQSLIFDRHHVALMPGARWLPMSGPEVGRDDPRVRPTDFFELDLTVELPEGWIAAGPARRQEVPGASPGTVRYRFAPPAPVPEVALIAGQFESRATEIEGVQFEILIHPAHAASLDVLEDAGEEIHDWIAERLREAADLGLAYPYDAFTLVEVPAILRGYGGGWRMDSTLAPPAMVLMRESGFPTARFDFAFRKPEQFRDQEGGVARAKRTRLEAFFENDFSGGNLFLGASRNFFSHITRGRGPEGLPLNFVCETLTGDLVTEKLGYFSVHLFTPELNAVIGTVIANWIAGQGQGKNFAETMIEVATSRSEVWETVLGVSLTDLDPWEDPRKVLDALTLKGGAMARSLRDGLGRENAGRLLAALRDRCAGRTFDREDVLAAGREVGEDFDVLLEVWLDETELPGFVVEQGDVQAFRLPDSEGGSPRYQVRFELRNDEPAPGLFVVESSAGHGEERRQETSDPIQVSGQAAVEFGLVSSRPPDTVMVVPYLAENREPFAIPLPQLDQEKIVQEEPFIGTRPVAWAPPAADTIVVDDLDPGFSVEEEETGPRWRLVGGSGDEETDRGLPVFQLGTPRPPTRWSRMSVARAWGKYRHTLAVIRAGEGQRRAILTATVPQAGPWELDLHLPSKEELSRALQADRGIWHLAVEDGSGRQETTFDADAGEDGWNALGSFELAGGAVRVELSDETEGKLVIADAIRWTATSGVGGGGE